MCAYAYIQFFIGKFCNVRMSHEEIEGQRVPLAERMVREPFWLGLITVLVVMIVIGVGYLVKKHLPEKIEKLLRTDLEANLATSGLGEQNVNSGSFTFLLPMFCAKFVSVFV